MLIRCGAGRLLRYLILTFLLFGSCCVLVCANGSGEKDGRKPDVQNGTSLAVPPQQKNGYFSSIKDAAILGGIEIGSPETIRASVAKLRQNLLNASEPEKVLLAVSYAIFTTVYPGEKITWELPVVPPGNVYVEILNSVQMGVYEFDPGGTDFLCKTLPSLVLFTAPNVHNYYAEAETSLKQALALKSDSVLAPYLLGEVYARQGKNELALQLFERAYRADTSCLQTAVAYARALLAAGKNSEAYLLGEGLLKQNPKSPDAVKICADAAYALKDWKTAEQYVAQILQADPNNQYYLLFRIRILIEQGEYLKASSLFDVYSRTDKTSRDYFLIRIRLQRDWNKNLQAASATAQEALKLYPNDEELMLLAADLSSQTGQKIAGLSGAELAGKVVALNPESPAALTILTGDAIRNRDWQIAYAQASKLLSLVSDESSHLLYIEACLGSGKTAEALDLAKKLYANNPSNENIQYAYIRSLVAAKQTDEASRLIDSLMSAAPLRMKSNLYYEKSLLTANEEQKLNLLRSSLTANPRNQSALFDLYQYYYGKKDYRKAQYYLKQVTAINPGDQNLLKLQAELDNLLAR